MTNVSAQAVVAQAAHWVGFDGEPNYGSPFGSWYGLPNEYWCAMFVSYVFARAASDTNTSNPLAGLTAPKGFAYCPSGFRALEARGQWRPRTATPAPGWLVFFDYGADGPGVPSHVGLVQSGPTDGTHFWTIQGDVEAPGYPQGNTCRRLLASLEDPALFGFGAVPLGAPAAPPAAPAEYTVAAGDTLSGIAAEAHTTFQALAYTNGIAHPDVINIGQHLNLHPTYTIRAGDTLSGIASRFAWPGGYPALAKLNGIANPDVITAGVRLRLYS